MDIHTCLLQKSHLVTNVHINSATCMPIWTLIYTSYMLGSIIVKLNSFQVLLSFHCSVKIPRHHVASICESTTMLSTPVAGRACQFHHEVAEPSCLNGTLSETCTGATRHPGGARQMWTISRCVFSPLCSVNMLEPMMRVSFRFLGCLRVCRTVDPAGITLSLVCWAPIALATDYRRTMPLLRRH